MSTQESQVQVRFVTKSAKYTVPDVPLLVPIVLKRDGLSELVNFLLKLETPVPFQFLAGGQLLRTSLASFIKSQPDLSAENILEIEYIESMVPPKRVSEYKVDDWISQVCTAANGAVLVGCYDGTAKVYDQSCQLMYNLAAHRSAVKAVAWMHSNAKDWQAPQTTFLTGSQDCSIMGWSLNQTTPTAGDVTATNEKGPEPSLQARPAFECLGHTGSIESISANRSGTQFASASSDGTIKLWSTREHSGKSQATVNETKRRKLNGSAIPLKRALCSLVGHNGAVNTVCYNTQDERFLYSGGFDYSLRTWDAERRVNLNTRPGDKVILDLAYSGLSHLIATANADRLIRLWDTRVQEGEPGVKLTLSGHRAWVSAVDWSPTSPFMLASASHDGTVKIWDVRSPTASLYTVNPAAQDMEESGSRKGQKLLTVDWSGSTLASGGEEGVLRLTSVEY
ncbi:WD40-repeat-containing domain protein [Dimargaris cristalligena]|uniref:Ribosome biogenesis protein YTM1 n=1 Tax=Dimargaris cristalligena TaxID=215637 RepID=A0A4P9ZWE0_9FUNG|nr:WD40-repeat-containing domain protein [Dimargaris cristalligena]|eukprot:RKP37954.1 WD40-repeat-containing domain protein [Dimargaris cristalligena]